MIRMGSSWGIGSLFEMSISSAVGAADCNSMCNVVIPSAYLNRDTQIDLVVITDIIYCVELKNYKESLIGNYDDKSWSCGSSSAAKRNRHSAYFQNLTHIQALRRLLYGTKWFDIPIVNVIVIPDTVNVRSDVREIVKVSRFWIPKAEKNDDELYWFLKERVSESEDLK